MKLSIVIISTLLILLLVGSNIVDAVKYQQPKSKNHKIQIDKQTRHEKALEILSNLQSNGGGWSCLGCTVGLSLIEQMSIIHEKGIDEMLEEICSYFPAQVGEICDWVVATFGNEIISLFDQYQHPDDVCEALKVCTDPTCRLYNNGTSPTYQGEINAQFHSGFYANKKVTENPWQWIKNLMNLFNSDHIPVEDIDGDRYSFTPTFRGYDWRGKDCDDLNPLVHPGTIGNSSEPNIDWNCNGINGTNSNGVQWEELLCGGSGQMGIIVGGDSAGAHFSIPGDYMTAAAINKTTYKDLIPLIEDEADWPHRSAYTGWEASTPDYTVDSIYLRLRERNLCNHRDYQNLAVNGGSSESILHSISVLARNQTLDHPVLLFIELIGNDVCSQDHSLDNMTPPGEFILNIEATLNFLDTALPNGSHVVFIGLVDGRVLWDNLWNRTHPVGVTYETIYSFLSCLHVNPCWGWLQANETNRNLMSERAALLSSLYPGIIANNTYNNFDMAYYPFPFNAINEQWIASGGQTWQLIEPIDGFHPNQIANALIGEYLWNSLMNDHPEWFGEVNPNNQQIINLFGDQGGY